ncbi:hypothetical protein [Kineococcus sp. NPDC059986]|jgi:uncharacterized membrane protein YjjP (DUF1212 family)|uniref:hypothetical protein n=1 Tax=Kineococcus sp. NPDC059986 TaxID=3155538 RepID=UPI00344F328D
MDETTARDQADEALRAVRAASRPSLPRPLCATAALCAGAGVALLAQGSGVAKVVTLVLALALLAAAHLIPSTARRRRGLHGYRGGARTENTTFLLCALVLVVVGGTATAALAAIFVGLGVAVAVAWYAMLRGVLVAGGRTRS